MFRIARANLWHHTAFAEKISACPNLTLETFDRMDAARKMFADPQVQRDIAAKDEPEGA